MSDAMGSLAATDEYDPNAIDWSRLNQPFGVLKDTNPIEYGTASPLVNIRTQDIADATDKAMAFSGGGLGIKAYHGSPHDFNAFDLSKIGSGEGAQAYGHGLYFADSENVAKSYRDALGGTATIDGAPAGQVALQGYGAGAKVTPEQQIADYISSYGTLQTARYSMANKRPDLLPIFDELEKSGRLKAGGHMYEVNINADPAHFLDWDKPLNAQSQMLDMLSKSRSPKIREILNDPNIQAPTRELYGRDLGPMTGEDLYKRISIAADGRVVGPGATPMIAKTGIPGIKYLDQGSRGAGEGSSNYVVFNDKLIDIMRKYGLAGAIGAGGMGALAAQDQYSNGGM